jgi:hypothetical protein
MLLTAADVLQLRCADVRCDTLYQDLEYADNFYHSNPCY